MLAVCLVCRTLRHVKAAAWIDLFQLPAVFHWHLLNTIPKTICKLRRNVRHCSLHYVFNLLLFVWLTSRPIYNMSFWLVKWPSVSLLCKISGDGWTSIHTVVQNQLRNRTAVTQCVCTIVNLYGCYRSNDFAARSIEPDAQCSWCKRLERSRHASQRTTVSSNVCLERTRPVAGASTQNGPPSSKCVHQSESGFFRKQCNIGKSSS